MQEKQNQQQEAEERLIAVEVENRVENELNRRFHQVIESAEWKKEVEDYLDNKSKEFEKILLEDIEEHKNLIKKVFFLFFDPRFFSFAKLFCQERRQFLSWLGWKCSFSKNQNFQVKSFFPIMIKFSNKMSSNHKAEKSKRWIKTKQKKKTGNQRKRAPRPERQIRGQSRKRASPERSSQRGTETRRRRTKASNSWRSEQEKARRAVEKRSGGEGAEFG